MARYTKTIPSKNPSQFADQIDAYLRSQGFKPSGEDPTTWKKGGLFSNPLFVRRKPTPGGIELEAWVQFLIFPGVGIGEYDLEGMFLMVQKKALKKHVVAIEELAV
jgi:hypothetical protein